MGYTGISVPIALGQSGLITDEPVSSLPLNALSKAFNISFDNGRISKMRGTLKYNSTALGASIVCVFDWWPDSSNQRVIAITADGKMWRDNGDRTFTSVTPIKTGMGVPSTDSTMISGGQESSGRSRKLFALTGTAQIQVLTGDSSVPANIAFPAADWATGNYPSFAIQYQNRLFVLNTPADRHRVYASTLSDHENFVGQIFGNASFELWQRIAATPNISLTTSIQAGANVNIFTTTANDGFIVYGAGKFDKLTFSIVTPVAAGPTYTYEYWNGSAWTALTTAVLPDFTAVAITFLTFTIPANWAVGDGTETGGNNLYYAVRVLATGAAPANAVVINSLIVTNTTADASPQTFSIFPGEGDGLISAYVYRGLLFLFKKPFGVYIIDGRDPDQANWTISKYSDAFGVSSPHAITQILGDLVAGNSMGSLTSLAASQSFGDFDAGDVLQNARVEEYIRNEINFVGVPYSQAIYYPEKKIAMFTGQSSTNLIRDRIIAIDVAREKPRVYLISKDEPNCLSLRKDSEGISRPMYGAANGFVYLMDQSTYNVDSVPYLGEIQTAYIDFGQVNQEFAGKNKIFDFLEVNYISIGNNIFYVDVFIDGEFRQQLTFTQTFGVALDSFTLDVDTLAGDPAGGRDRRPLKSCTGNKISFRIYNNSLDESFQIERLIVGFRLSAEQVYANQI